MSFTREQADKAVNTRMIRRLGTILFIIETNIGKNTYFAEKTISLQKSKGRLHDLGSEEA
jgi:hypothetical protein